MYILVLEKGVAQRPFMSILKRGIFIVVIIAILGIGLAGYLLQDLSVDAEEPPDVRIAATATAPGPTSIPSTPILTRTPTPEPTSTRTPTPAGYEPHPLSIDLLRLRDYEGSDFIVEQTLRPGVNYDAYVVSYLSDDLKIYAMLTVPRGDKPVSGWPVVIFNHGYIPPSQYRTTQRYEAYVDAFARSGYIVLKSDYRGHGSSEGRAEGAYGSPAYVIDVLNAVASIKRFADADPNRIGMWGHSMGGYITLRAMVVDPTIKAGVIWGGVVVSYEDMYDLWWTNRRSSLETRYGTPEDNPDFWQSISANHYLKDISGPLQLHHAKGDATVPYEMSVVLDQEMKDAGQYSQLLLYERDDHNISRNRDVALTVSVVFFDQHVKG